MNIGEHFSIEVGSLDAAARPFEGFIFLCGGPSAQDKKVVKSARQFALEKATSTDGRIAGCRLIIAERVTDLLEGGVFDDLLEFEKYLAALASCIVIFVESPGSIAELGCFSVLEEVSPKLLVVCEHHYEQAGPSFIFKGPIALLQRREESSVQIFPYHRLIGDSLAVCPSLLEGCWGDLLESIHAAVKRPVTSEPIDPTKIPHQLLLASDIVWLCVAIRMKEVKACLEALDVNFEHRDLQKALSVLEKFGLIEKLSWGKEFFYFSKDTEPRVSFHPKQGAAFDATRFQISCIEIYRKHDEKKFRAIKAKRELEQQSVITDQAAQA